MLKLEIDLKIPKDRQKCDLWSKIFRSRSDQQCAEISLVLLQGDGGGVFSVNISNSNIADGDEV